MNRNITIALAVLGLAFVGLSTAQVAGRVKSSKTSTLSAAPKIASPFESVHENAIQRAFGQHLVGQQNAFLTRADTVARTPEQNNRLRTLVLARVNLYQRAILSPEQQEAFDNNVLDVKHYAPSTPEWREALTCPTMVKAMLNISAAQEAQFTRLEAEETAAIDAGYADMPEIQPGQSRVDPVWLEKQKKRIIDAYRTKIAGMRKVMTPAQVSEWDNVLNLLKRDLEAIVTAN